MFTVPRVSAALATVLIETFFYGIYLVLFFTSVYLLLTVKSRELRRGIPVWLSPIVCGGTVLFVAVTGHWILTMDRLFLAFVSFEGGANPQGFYGDFSQPTQITQSIFLLASLAIVDGLFVHRLWTVWAHNRWVMIFPSVTLVGLVVSTVGVWYDFSQFKPGDDVHDLANVWIIMDCACTVFTNIYCTVFIAWRLWRVNSIVGGRPEGGRTLMSVLVIIVESAALSAVWAVFFISAYAAQSNLRFLIDVTPPLVGALNMLIYVRVGLGWAHGPAPSSRRRPMALRFATTRSDVGDETIMDDYIPGKRPGDHV
ncbi:hypothetical protein B0H15DRAFT_914660 [Mycena belliarum]|uniref:Uncharacterized protein n=1 Tax=Mycena belliarum TaxID=1033014 RepID=A0AAD6TUI0_9AGAR|nr:hypothetical protein B0H15DRAFT_914660 [Mycena belliae]